MKCLLMHRGSKGGGRPYVRPLNLPLSETSNYYHLRWLH